MTRYLLPILWTTVISVFVHVVRVQAETTNKLAPYLEQSFAFDYAPSTQDPPIPITEQCETIHISWGRQGFTTGPNPVAPYFLQIYTSAYIFPVVIPAGDPSTRTFDWAVPFAPGTQYQICMFDSNGASGGCQRMYTVIPSRSVTQGSTPNCANLTFPASTLAIEGLVNNGPLSQFGWIDSCSDVSIRPLNGTPPFTLTVAPTLHPVWNLTSSDMSAINWTVQLTWASPFFISLVDSTGESWSNGPLHSGMGANDCLSQTSEQKNRVPESVAVGSGVGGLVLGAILGIFGTWYLTRRRSKQLGQFDDQSSTEQILSSGLGKSRGHTLDAPANADHYSAIPTALNSPPPTNNLPNSLRSRQSSSHRLITPGSGYEVEPFQLPTQATSDARSADNTSANQHGNNDALPTSPTTRSEPSHDSAGQQRSMSHVYVVHHDAGRAPVSVYTPDGTEVIELPPRYTGDASRSPNPNPIQQQRTAGTLPRKMLPTPPSVREPSGSGTGNQ